MRTPHRVLAPVLACLGLSTALLSGCSSSTDSSAGCVAHRSQTSVAEVTAGQSLQVSADWLWSDCNDTNGGTWGHALRDQAITWTQSQVSTELARADADPRTAHLEVAVTVPASARPGPAEIRIGDAEPAKLTVIGSP